MKMQGTCDLLATVLFSFISLGLTVKSKIIIVVIIVLYYKFTNAN